MFVTLFFVKEPDFEAAKKLDDEYRMKVIAKRGVYFDEGLRPCMTEAKAFDSLRYEIWVIHGISFISALWREIFDSKMNTIGQLMRGFEMIVMLAYFYTFISCLLHFSTWFIAGGDLDEIKKTIWNGGGEHDIETLKAFDLVKPDFFDPHNMDLWGGKMLEWFLLEILVFLFYIIGMKILMLKSRFYNIGTDMSR